MSIHATSLDTARLTGMRRRMRRRQDQGDRGIRFVDLPQARVRVRVAGSASPTIVFVADPPNVIEHYDELFELLSPHMGVICFEAPGFGFSAPNRGFGFTLEEQAGAGRELLRALDLGPYILAFSCVGAYGALRIAAEDPEMVERLIVIQAPSWSEERAWARRIDRGGWVSRPVIGQAILAFGGRRVTQGWYQAALPKGAPQEPFLSTSLEAFEQGACYCLASGFQANFRRDVSFSAIEQPAAVIWGSADRTHRRTDKRSILEHLPRARYMEFETAGHFPELEHPRRFTEFAREFSGK